MGGSVVSAATKRDAPAPDLQVRPLGELLSETDHISGAIVAMSEAMMISDGHMLIAAATVTAFYLDRIHGRHGERSAELAAEMVKDIIRELRSVHATKVAAGG